ncbi:MAG: hypothetical protein ACR2KL_03015 [Nocardioidaceae bacterium]
MAVSGHFLPSLDRSARHSQVYPELGRLQADGLVAGEVIDGPRPRPPRRYASTPDGGRALATWLTSPVKPAPQRSEFLLRIFCFAQLGVPAAEALVVEERERHVKRLADYRRHRGRLRARTGRHGTGLRLVRGTAGGLEL